jgi:radical SAM superfamily enzyme
MVGLEDSAQPTRLWCLDKPALLRAIHQELERRDSWQGKNVAGEVVR